MRRAGAVLMMVALCSGPGRLAAAESLPSGASLAWTSDDDVVAQARKLVEAGSLKQAETVLSGAGKSPSDASRQARAEMLETIRRIRGEYTLTLEQLVERLRKSIPDIAAADVERWREQGDVRFREIDGATWYFRREPSSLLRFSAEAKRRRSEHAARTGKRQPDDSVADANLREHIRQVIGEAVRTGRSEVVPVRHRMHYTLTIQPDRPGAKAGSTVRCWLPFPQEYRQQKGVRLLRTSPARCVVADNAMKNGVLAGPRQRTVYFEQKIEDPAKPMTFEEEFEYLSYAYYPVLDDAAARPEVTVGAEYLAERPPHIVFTPQLRATVDGVVGGETNPLAKARRIFRYITANVRWCPEVEYATIPNLSDKCLKTRRGDCGVQAMLFITMCRAAGVPARWQSGWASKPDDENMHDWAEFHVEPWGWLPCDVSYGLQKSDDPLVREFYFGHQDAYRLIVNLDYGWPFSPPKTSLRSEPADLQRGEVEIDGRNLYFDEWTYEMRMSVVRG